MRTKFTHHVNVNPQFLGIEGESVSGKIVAIESYKDNVLTFSWLSNSGHLFCYLPAIAFSKTSQNLSDFVDFNCPDTKFSICDMGFEGSGCGIVSGKEILWKRYLCTIDWYDANYLAHLVLNYDSDLILIRNSKFQIGGNKFSPPNWKKARSSWSLLNKFSGRI